MEKIDARGLDCPEPGVKTKKALQNNNEVLTLVDNQAAAENVKRMAIKLNCEVEISKGKDYYQLNIKKASGENKDQQNSKGKIYFIKSDTLGEGKNELGKVLIQGFVHTLLETDPLPQKIIFMNSGVKLPVNNKDVIDSLKSLEEKGVTILACGTCLDYYELKDKLKVGSISNMYEIVESLNEKQVVSI